MSRLILLCLTMGCLLSAQLSAVEIRTETLAGVPVTVCTVRLKEESLELFIQDESGQPYRRFERLIASLDQRGRKLAWP